jgi:hypothetical protein
LKVNCKPVSGKTKAVKTVTALKWLSIKAAACKCSVAVAKVAKHKARQWAAACHKTQVTNLHHNRRLPRKINMRQRPKLHRLTKRQLSNNMQRQHLPSKLMVSNRRSLTLSHSKVVMRLSLRLHPLIKRQQLQHNVQHHSHSKTSLQIWMMAGMTISRSSRYFRCA